MRLITLLLFCASLAAQDGVTAHINDFVHWRSANPGLRSEEEDLRQYRAKLVASKLSEEDADAIILELRQNRDRVSVARWNASLLDPHYRMSRAANRLLVEAVKGRKPGSALDIGMGTGRNSLYLAELGWSVTGFDTADGAVNATRKSAADAGLRLQTAVADFDRFDYGRERWDIVVDLYEFVPVRKLRQRIFESLKPGGLWIIEGFATRSESQRPNANGEGAYQSGELVRLLVDQFKILRYEEVNDTADFGLEVVPLVRVIAQKK